VAQARRRRFDAAYKQRIVREADACKEPGEIGALLRREGLYSSHLTAWRAEIRQRELEALSPKKRGPKVDERDRKIADLQREIEQLRKRAERAELICEIQKKVSAILGVTLPPPPDSDGKR
jgi:transposase-like protein